MSQESAAIWAAVITSIAALLAGGFAFAAALRQVTKTALTQREQAWWQLRRNTFADFLNKLRDLRNAYAPHAEALISGTFDGSKAAAWASALDAYHKTYSVLDLEAPESLLDADAVRDTWRTVQMVETVVQIWEEAVLNGQTLPTPLGTNPQEEFERLLSYMTRDADQTRRAFRAELHKELDF
ncbi:hypothetical protein [Streptomyces incanus]|uniref:Secreted protein n=1 Tax=Streptomyces incanus TaxID=887453 RepID=A0ABW0XXB7_9ACTN